MKTLLLRCAVAVVLLLIAWLFGTRPLARFVDRFFTVRLASLPVRPIVYDPFGGVKIGDWWMTIPVAELGDFLAEGNEISLTKERSYLSWPNPFEMNFMTGSTPSKKRFTYYKLVASKPSGARLEMLWRFEEYFYKNGGWAGADMVADQPMGLIRVVR